MKRTLVLAFLTAAAGAACAQVPSGYVTQSAGDYVKNSTGLCWRTGYWTPALATAACDPELAPRPAAAPVPAAPPPVAAPKPAPKPVFERARLSIDVLFEFDKADLKPEGRAQLDTLAAQVAAISLDVLVAVGHADRIGSRGYNERLSVRRANAIKDYLVAKGVAANRIYAEGKGESQPVTKGKCAKLGPDNRRNLRLVDCLQPDRRVEIEVVGTRAK